MNLISRNFALRGALLLGATGAIAFGAVEAADAMRMYYVDDPVGRNVVNIESRGQLETMLTRTSDIKADIAIDPNNVLNNPRARFVINIASLDTGIALRNEHMLSAEWMNAAQFPTATFELTRVLSPTKKTPLRDGKGSGEIEGDLTLHGVTKKVRAQLEIESIAQSAITKDRLPGDLMHIRAQFPLKLADFGINVPPPAQLKVAATQQVTVDVFSSTQKPEMPGSANNTAQNNPTQKDAGTPVKRTKMDNGLIIEDEKVGDGAEAVPGKKVTVHYRGTLENGTQFDASYDRGEPFQFTLGAGQVIQGWDEGVKGMKVGGKRKLTIPSELGYGARGAGGVIPPNATLIFEVELLKVG